MSHTLNSRDIVFAVSVEGEDIVKLPEKYRENVFMFRKNTSSKLFIKRLAALPGDTVKVSNGVLYVDNSNYFKSICVNSLKNRIIDSDPVVWHI